MTSKCLVGDGAVLLSAAWPSEAGIDNSSSQRHLINRSSPSWRSTTAPRTASGWLENTFDRQTAVLSDAPVAVTIGIEGAACWYHQRRGALAAQWRLCRLCRRAAPCGSMEPGKMKALAWRSWCSRPAVAPVT